MDRMHTSDILMLSLATYTYRGSHSVRTHQHCLQLVIYLTLCHIVHFCYLGIQLWIEGHRLSCPCFSQFLLASELISKGIRDYHISYGRDYLTAQHAVDSLSLSHTHSI